MDEIIRTHDASREFSECLEESLKSRGLYTPAIHVYLTGAMTRFVEWKRVEIDEENEKKVENPTAPQVHTKTTHPFVFQLNRAKLEHWASHTQLFDNMKAIGESLLLGVGYWPESLTSTEVRSRPQLLYYASLGSDAYASASRSAQRAKLSRDTVYQMTALSNRFRTYVLVIYDTRKALGSPPITNLETIINFVKVTRDEDILKRYLLTEALKKGKKTSNKN